MREDIKNSLDCYVNHGRPTGDFLRAVLANDLMMAFGRADIDNQRDMFSICDYVYNYMPDNCHGSYEIVDRWLATKRNENK